MARTRSALSDVARAVELALEAADLLHARVAVGLSGGVDSVTLLHVLAQFAPAMRLTAVHVHHGLSPNADAWADFCADFCRSLAVPLSVARVRVDRSAGRGIEAAARAATYAVFQQQDADAIALAHHADDQGETLLLRLLRGAGVKGLRAMPTERPLTRGGATQLVRPFLHVTRAQILAAAQSASLRWIEDEGNADPSIDRSFLRMRVLPPLRERYPGVRDTLARAADNLADAATLLDELAAMDARDALAGRDLSVAALRKLSPERARNLLRWHLEREGWPAPSREQLANALHQLFEARAGARVAAALGPLRLRRYRDRVHLEAEHAAPPPDWSVTWRGESELVLPAALGTLRFDSAWGAGLSIARLREGEVVVRARRGGERMRIAAGRPTRTLKNLLQEAGVPEWERPRLPLICVGTAPVWIALVGMDPSFAARAGEEGVLPHWCAVDTERR